MRLAKAVMLKDSESCHARDDGRNDINLSELISGRDFPVTHKSDEACYHCNQADRCMKRTGRC
jgi:hypothetical protein